MTPRRICTDDDIVNGLLGATGLCDEPRIRALCVDARRAFLRQPMLLRLQAPIKVVGDLHGQFVDLLRLFDVVGRPPKVDFLFLGDFVDRGPQSVEVHILIYYIYDIISHYQYKRANKSNIFRIRGPEFVYEMWPFKYNRYTC